MVASDPIKFHEPSEYNGGGGADPNPNPPKMPNLPPTQTHNRATVRNMAHRFGGSGKGGKLDIQHEKE